MAHAAGVEMKSDAANSDIEQTKEEILAGIRMGFREALAGETRPLNEVIEEVRRELDDNADCA